MRKGFLMKIAQSIINEVLQMNSQGLATKAIARKLKISPKSVRRYIQKEKISEIPIKEEIISKDEKVLNFTLENNSKHLDKILKERGYDPNDWTIKNIYHNEWQSQKAKNQGLVTLYQFKVHLIRKDSEITSSNISINISNSLKTDIVKRKFKKAVIIPDIQCGFRRDLVTGQLKPIHDRIALATALALTREVNPDRIIFLGDNLDLAEMSIKYTATPDFYFTTQASIVELAWWLGKFRQLNPNTQIDYTEGNHECFSEDTEIMTSEGWVKYYEVTPETKIGTFNKETKEIEFQKYLEKQVYDYDGEMYSIFNSSSDLLITPNHRIYWANHSKRSNLIFEMNKISNVELNESRKWQYSSGLNNKQDLIIEDNLIKLIAWIITDGSTRKNGNYKNIILYQRKSKLHLITNILDSLNIKYSIKERMREISEICGVKTKSNEAQCEITINSENSKNIYNYIDDKYILPAWLYSLSERQVDVFLQSLIDGDGSRKNTCKAVMLYGCKEVLDQVQHLLTLNGYRTSIYTYRNNQYKLNISKNNKICFDRISKHISKQKYTGKVWDFTVPNDTLVVRRNNKISITGNCRMSKLLNEKAISILGIKAANAISAPPALSVESLLNLDTLKIKYHGPYPTGVVKINKNLICIHGTVAKGESGATVSTVVRDARVSVIQGHIHRYEVATKTVWDANNNYHMYTAASFGCLCSLEPGVVPGMKHLQNWQQGIGVVTYEDFGQEEFRQEFIPIIKGRSLFNDKEFIPTEESQIITSIEKDTKFKVS